jgi:hypothetical protein
MASTRVVVVSMIAVAFTATVVRIAIAHVDVGGGVSGW